jgi:DNA-binding CsgD family transcriptional regulator
MTKMEEFTMKEIQYLKEVCNFTEQEERIFLMRAKGKSIISISIEEGVSDRTVNRRLKKIKAKIHKAL